MKTIGVDRAVGYGVLTRLWGMGAGVLSVLLITTRLTKSEQGYYYTFGSLLALQVFFELGLLNVISQFASHEFAHLSWGERGVILGPDLHRDRFVDLLSKSLAWYGVGSVLITVVLVPVGLAFFKDTPGQLIYVAWKTPWVLAVLAVSLNLLLIPFYGVIMGSGDVATINMRELHGGVLGIAFSWIVLVLHGGIFAIAASFTGNLIVGAYYLFTNKPELLRVVFKPAQRSRVQSRVSWSHEVWPMQWRIALSWVSGYFIFQLFTPVLFKYHGPILAGQMGIVLAMSNALLALSMAWMQTKSPIFGKHVALRQWRELDALFFKALYQSTSVAVVGGIALVILVGVLQAHFTIGARILPVTSLALFVGGILCQVIINGFAIYMRAHKTEPMLALSVVGGVLIGASTLLLGRYYGGFGVCLGYFLLSILYGIPATYLLWRKFRVRMHGPLA